MKRIRWMLPSSASENPSTSHRLSPRVVSNVPRRIAPVNGLNGSRSRHLGGDLDEVIRFHLLRRLRESHRSRRQSSKKEHNDRPENAEREDQTGRAAERHVSGGRHSPNVTQLDTIAHASNGSIRSSEFVPKEGTESEMG